MNENETSFQATASVDNEDIIAWTAASDIESVLRNSSPQIGEAAIAGAVTAESAARREDVKTAILSRLHDLNTDLEKKQATIDTERQLLRTAYSEVYNSVLSKDPQNPPVQNTPKNTTAPEVPNSIPPFSILTGHIHHYNQNNRDYIQLRETMASIAYPEYAPHRHHTKQDRHRPIRSNFGRFIRGVMEYSTPYARHWTRYEANVALLRESGVTIIEGKGVTFNDPRQNAEQLANHKKLNIGQAASKAFLRFAINLTK